MKLSTDCSDGDSDYKENFYRLRHILYPIILTKNCFYTYLAGPPNTRIQTRPKAIVDLYVEGLAEYIAML